MSVVLEDWLTLLRREYLEDFIAAGGAGVKFAVVADHSAGEYLHSKVSEISQKAGFLVASIDAGKTRLHLLQQVFHEVARQIPWEDLARRVVRRCYLDLGMVCEEEQLRLEEVAAANGVDPRFLRKDLRQAIEGLLRRTHQLGRDFRYAMVCLCMDQATQWQAGPDSQLILQWLSGNLRLISAVNKLFLFQKIGRHNARTMLSSLSAWCRIAGLPGLTLLIDIRALGQPRVRDAGSLNYTAPAAMDAYEVLRQLIDSTDDMRGMLTIVVADPDLLQNEKRGVKVYKALYERIWPDVRLRKQDNPLSALISLNAANGRTPE